MTSDGGGPMDGLTLMEATQKLEGEGFGGQFAAAEADQVRCLTCREEFGADQVDADRLLRTEGESDPDDMAAVVAVTCLHCGAKGTLVLKYGPEASLEESSVLARLARG